MRSTAPRRHLSKMLRNSTHTPISTTKPTQLGRWAKKACDDDIIADYTLFRGCTASAGILTPATIGPWSIAHNFSFLPGNPEAKYRSPLRTAISGGIDKERWDCCSAGFSLQ
jgi:hypothetical protein